MSYIVCNGGRGSWYNRSGKAVNGIDDEGKVTTCTAGPVYTNRVEANRLWAGRCRPRCVRAGLGGGPADGFVFRTTCTPRSLGPPSLTLDLASGVYPDPVPHSSMCTLHSIAGGHLWRRCTSMLPPPEPTPGSNAVRLAGGSELRGGFRRMLRACALHVHLWVHAGTCWVQA